MKPDKFRQDIQVESALCRNEHDKNGSIKNDPVNQKIGFQIYVVNVKIYLLKII